MENIEKFVLKNTDILLQDSQKNIKRFKIGKYKFHFMGEGSFGVIYKITGDGKNIIIKIMKKEDAEPKKCLKIKEKIEDIKDKSKKKLYKNILLIF